MSKRLCMVLHGTYPLGEPRVSREAQVALECGFEVEVLALKDASEAARETVDRVEVRRLPIRHRRGRGFLWMLLEYVGFTFLASVWLAVRPRRFRVVQIHNPPDFLVAVGLLPKLFGARLIFDIHDLSPDMFAARFERTRRSHLIVSWLRGIEKTATALANEVITVHEPYRRVLIERGVNPQKVSVVMNSLDEALLPVATQAREPGVFRVVYHGTITHWYGVEIVVEACAKAQRQIPGLRLELYGDGDALTKVRDLVERLGLNGNVRISGRYLPHEEALRAVAGASVGVIPNLENSLNRFALSSKLFEYVMLGIPVACSRLPTLEEHFSEEELLFFASGNADELANAMIEIAENGEAARARAERAMLRCEGYRWHKSAERYAAMLETLM